jgi:hypothetical protein
MRYRLWMIADERDVTGANDMSELQIVKHDQGGVNARILAKETKADFRRVEAASLKIKARFTSAEGKRFFAGYFNTLQLNDPLHLGDLPHAARPRRRRRRSRPWCARTWTR